MSPRWNLVLECFQSALLGTIDEQRPDSARELHLPLRIPGSQLPCATLSQFRAAHLEHARARGTLLLGTEPGFDSSLPIATLFSGICAQALKEAERKVIDLAITQEQGQNEQIPAIWAPRIAIWVPITVEFEKSRGRCALAVGL